MSDGVKFALVAGGVAIAGYFVVKAVAAPKAVPTRTAPSSTATTFISGIVSGVGSILSSKASAPANAPLTNIGTYQQGYEDAYFGANSTPDTASVQDTEAGFQIAQNPLQAIPLFGG